MRFIVCLLLFGIAVSAECDAQSWTLSQCISYAKEHNITIKRQRLSERDAAVELNQARQNYVPSLSGATKYNLSNGRVLDPTTYQYIENSTASDLNVAVALSTDIFAGMKKLHTKRLAEVRLKAALADVVKAENDVTLDVTAAYFEILLSEENIKIVQYKIKTLASQSERTVLKLQAKVVTVGDLLQVLAEMADANNELLSAENQRVLSQLEMCQLLEIEDYRNFSIMHPDSSVTVAASFPYDDDRVLDMAQSLPEITSAELYLKAAEKEISIARAGRWPVLTMEAGYGSSYSDARRKAQTDASGNPIINDVGELVYAGYPFREQIRDNASSYMALSLNVPIFNSSKARNQIKSANIARQRAEYNLQQVHKQLGDDVKQAMINARTAFNKYTGLIATVELNEETFRYVEEKLNVNMSTYYDYMISLNNLTQARAKLQHAKYEYVLRSRIIDFYMGNE